MRKKNQASKLNIQSMTMFHYYRDQLLPSLMKDFTPTFNSPHRFYVENRNVAYHYFGDVVSLECKIQSSTVSSAAKEIYLSNGCTKTGEMKGFKQVNCKMKIIPISGWASDHIDLVVLTEQDRKMAQKEPSKGLGKRTLSGELKYPFERTNQKVEKVKSIKGLAINSDDYCQLFVIHRSQKLLSRESLEWLNFIEKYTFFKHLNEDDENEEKIIYEAIFVYQMPGGLFSWNYSGKLLQSYFESCCPLNRDGKSILLLQMQQKIQMIQQAQFKDVQRSIEMACFHSSHRRSLKLPAEHKPTMDLLLAKAVKYFAQINPKRELNNYFLQQLVCRMMDNNSYKQSDSWSAIVYYLDFEKRMRDKYKWQDFREFREMNVFVYIGRDNMGRPILLNRIRNTLMSKVKDKDKFFDYHLYLFEIYMQDQMQGWVDQFDVIADAGDQVSDNTDIMLTKRLLFEMAKTTLGRSYQIVVFDVGMLGQLFTKLVFPLLPDFFLRSVHLFGNDRAKPLAKLRELMSLDVIPDFLGGNNTEVYESVEKKLKRYNSSSQLSEGNTLSVRNFVR